MLLPLLVAVTAVSQDPAPAQSPEAAALEKISNAADRLAAAAERISPPPPPVDKDAPPPKEDLWAGSAGVGLTWVTGNVTSVAFVANGQATRKSAKTIFVAKGFGGYGEKLPDSGSGPSEVLLYNAGVTAQFDYRFTSFVSAFVGVGIDMDHVKSIEVRGYGDVGVGLLWLDTKEGPAGKEYQKVYLKTDLSLRVQPEERVQYYPTAADLPDTLLVGPRLGVSFRYALSPATYFNEEAEVIPNVLPNEAGRVLFNSTSKLAVGVSASVAINASFVVKYDSLPAAGRKNTDTILAVGVEASF
jgi:opacity protein-like surface antigen